jgi:beta-phosphoglucomutase
VEGLPEFLLKLDHLGAARAIATSAPRSNVDFTLKKTGIGSHFATILDDSFVSHGKPHPEVYLKAAAALQVNPANCIVFEDSIAGVEAGKKAGSRVVGLTTTHTSDELVETDYIIENFVGLEPQVLISKLFRS